MRIGMMEILIILLVVGAVAGSQQLPMIGKKAGKAVKELKKNSKEFTEAMKSVKEEMNDIKDMVTIDLTDEVNNEKK